MAWRVVLGQGGVGAARAGASRDGRGPARPRRGPGTRWRHDACRLHGECGPGREALAHARGPRRPQPGRRHDLARGQGLSRPHRASGLCDGFHGPAQADRWFHRDGRQRHPDSRVGAPGHGDADLDGDPGKAKALFYADCADADVRAAIQRLCPEPATMSATRSGPSVGARLTSAGALTAMTTRSCGPNSAGRSEARVGTCSRSPSAACSRQPSRRGDSSLAPRARALTSAWPAAASRVPI